MVTEHRHDHLRWMAPHPLWLADTAGLNGTPGRPAILRFATDAFMDEMIALTATRPEALPAWLAVPETWRAPAPNPPREGLVPTLPLSFARARATGLARRRGLIGGAASKPDVQPDEPLKLYQPAQDRFYMVAAQLVCARPGLPDRRITAVNQERARFVIRRVVPPEGVAAEFDPGAAGVTEYAFVPRDNGGVWRLLAPGERTRLLPEEERLGLFPLAYGTEGRQRRLLLGALPIARRETYATAPLGTEDDPTPPLADPDGPSPLALLWQTDVTAPWRALEEQAEILERVLLEPPQPTPPLQRATTANALLVEFRARAASIGWLILADARRFLETYLPNLWAALIDPDASHDLTDGENALKSAIEAIEADSDLEEDFELAYPAYAGRVHARFVDALRAITDEHIALLEAADTAFEWPSGGTPNAAYPDFIWIAAHPGVAVNTSPATPSVVAETDWRTPAASAIDELESLIEGALPTTPAGPVPDLRAPPAADPSDEPWFTIRCVFERPNCEGFAAPEISAPSAPFRMASFFDPDAPARTIRIPMPADISPAGLRKFRKGVGFGLSDLFCGQFNRFKDIGFVDLVRSVLPWPLHKDLPGTTAQPCGKSEGNVFGLLVSISIPIVTICAFILMTIMVALLDMVFRWLPYLLTVIRIPLGKGTKQ